MNRQNILIAFLFASAAAGIVLAAYEVERRHDAYVATHPQPQVKTSKASKPLSWTGFIESVVRGIDPVPASAARTRSLYPRLLLLLSVGSYFWLVFVAFEAGAGWGIAVLFGNWIAGLIFLIAHFEKAIKPTLLGHASLYAYYYVMKYKGF